MTETEIEKRIRQLEKKVFQLTHRMDEMRVEKIIRKNPSFNGTFVSRMLAYEKAGLTYQKIGDLEFPQLSKEARRMRATRKLKKIKSEIPGDLRTELFD